jgi:hypothetical protein
MADMAPLFVADADTLRTSLRLSALNTSPTDAVALVDDAIREVRLGFMRRLGASRVAVLVGFTYDPESGAPDTENKMLRECANLTEILWVKKLLLTRLPTVFRDSGGEARLDFNTEALSRETPQEDRLAELDRLNATIEDNLDFLAGRESVQDSWKATTFEPKCPFRPGQTAFRRDDRFFPFIG